MKLFIYAMLMILLVLGSASSVYANVVRLIFIDYSNFKHVEGNIYLSESLSYSDETRLVSLLKSARARISTHYGEPTAKPEIVVLSSKEEKRHFGLNDLPGMFLFAPWGEYLLMSHDDAGVDVLAHELVHAEIVARVGYFKRQLEIPTWFDEGVAMQVDYRPEYQRSGRLTAAEHNRIIGLQSPSDFWTNDKSTNIQNYRGAKAVVSTLFENKDASLYKLLADIKSGQSSVDDFVAAHN